MWFQDLQKYQITLCLLICIYVTKVNAGTPVLIGGGNSNEINFHQKGATNLNAFNVRNKFQCPSLFGTFSDIEDCSKFYLCVAGIPQRLPCPRSKRFDKYRRKCLHFIVAICDKGGKDTTHPDREVTTEKDPSFMCPRMFGSFEHSTECSNYYACSFFIPTLKTCPEEELFDEVKKECRHEGEVNCGSRNRPTSKTTPFTTPFLPEFTPTEHSTSQEPTTSRSTTPEPITTEPTIPESTTPELTTTEPTIPESTTPEPTTAEPTIPESTTPEPTTTEPTIPESTTPEPTTPEPTTPEATTPLITTTTTEEQTAPDHNCDDDDLDCIITETGEIPSWFKCPVELGSHRHPSSKKLFIFCINWKPFVKKCGQDLVYSKEVETCVSPENII